MATRLTTKCAVWIECLLVYAACVIENSHGGIIMLTQSLTVFLLFSLSFKHMNLSQRIITVAIPIITFMQYFNNMGYNTPTHTHTKHSCHHTLTYTNNTINTPISSRSLTHSQHQGTHSVLTKA